jgi:tetratricopeptide (TPR) repeat protein
VLSDGMFLTPDVFESLSVAPDIVVLNACHLSAITRSLAGMNHVAASVARTLIQIGVRAVVAAGWAVDDRAAAVFAGQLYRSLLIDGADFGTAVSQARRLTHDEHPTSMTWGAYQCYGDPGFRLTTKRSQVNDGPVFTENELRRRARHIISAAGDQGRSGPADELADADDVEPLKDRLLARLEILDPKEPIEDGLHRDHLSSAALADLAEAYGELGEFRTAIELYTRAVRHERADAPIRSLEQLGNLQIREAQRLVAIGATANPSREATQLLNDSLQWLTSALALNETGERLAMLGSYYKKRAAISPARSGPLLLKSLDFYRRAQQQRPKDYHLLLWIQLSCVIRLRGGDIPEQYESSLDQMRAAFKACVRSRPAADGFWGRATRGDRALTRALLEQNFEFRQTLTEYRKAFGLRSSARERAAVCDHLHDLARLVPAGDVRERLDTAHQALSSWTERR